MRPARPFVHPKQYQRYVFPPGFSPGFFKAFPLHLLVVIASTLLLPGFQSVHAQTYERELNIGAKATLTIRNRNGRVSVIASDDEELKPLLQATSPGAAIEPRDVSISGGEITVRERPEQDRIDLTVRVPARTRVKIESESGMVDVIGDLALAEVTTNTGTIHADVPLDDVKFKFIWQASRPRFLSDVELPKVKEGRAGSYSISGKLGAGAKKSKDQKKETPEEEADGDGAPINRQTIRRTKTEKKQDNEKKAAKEKLVQLNLTTQRGVILLNVDPAWRRMICASVL